MGSVIGSKLADGGKDVMLLDVARKAMNRINSEGPRIEGQSGEPRAVNGCATTDPAAIDRVDPLIVFTKNYYTEVAVSSAALAVRRLWRATSGCPNRACCVRARP